jgi:hypothetical protein
LADPDAPNRRDRAFGEAVARAARYHLDHAPRGFRDDCSGFAAAVFDRAGFPLAGGTRDLWEQAQAASALHRRTRPDPGDLAFFDNTYDRDRNGRTDDPLTHVAVVIAVEEDGTIRLAHAGTSAGRATLTMNLRWPHQTEDTAGKRINDHLRAPRRHDPPGTRYLASELWRGFASIRPADRERWPAADS